MTELMFHMIMAEEICELRLLYNDRTPLHWAVIRENCEQLKILLQNGEDPNTQDGEGNSPLHYILSPNSELVETLVNYGANVNFKNKYDRTPLHILVSNTNLCIKARRLKSVKMLLEKGANVNSQDYKGSTSLHDLIRYNRQYITDPSENEMCDLLLSYAANVQLQDLKGRTSLHLAVSMESVFTAILLESTSGKCAVNIPDKSGDYPLHTAVRTKNLEGTKLLLDNGARVNCRNGSGETALHIISNFDYGKTWNISKGLMKLLLQRGAEVNSQDEDGRTSLDHAAKHFVEYNRYRVVCSSSILHQLIDILLDWGASFAFEDASSLFEDQIKYEIRKTCLGLPPKVTKQVLSVQEFQNYEKNCCKEVKRMKSERHGNISLYDIFHQQFDPYFLSNESLIITLRSTHLEEHYPIYASLLTSTYHRSMERVQLFESVPTILQSPLPFEVMRFILSFVDNESLRNVIKAKELL